VLQLNDLALYQWLVLMNAEVNSKSPTDFISQGIY